MSKIDVCLDEITAYLVTVVISFLFTFALSCYTRKQNNFADDPWIGMVIYYVCGAIKTLLGVLLLTVLYPADCGHILLRFYGVAAIIIGLSWINSGRELGKANSSQSDGVTGAGELDLGAGLIHTAVLV